MPAEYIVAGLGNPGERYRRTRHNLGFGVVEMIAGARGARWRHPGPNRRVARVDVAGRDVLLVEPLTFMNLSGDALAPLVRSVDLPLSHLLVVCDDIALPLGQVRLRPAGSDGGHNGLASVIERLDETAFPRLRLGIGPVPPRVDAAEFVLAEFLPEEGDTVVDLLREAAVCVEAWLVEGIDRAMARFNAHRPPPDGVAP